MVLNRTYTTPTNQICNLIQLHPAKRRRVTLLISRLLEGGEEKIKIDFVLLLIRKIETLHLRSAKQHVVVTDVGSLHSCTGRGLWGACGKRSQASLLPELQPPPRNDPRPDDTLRSGKTETWKGRQDSEAQ